MKVVILGGGLGTRLSEDTSVIPKPMVKIGEKPIIWHIMKIYSTQGYNDFIICLGHKGDKIKEYFLGLYSDPTKYTINVALETVEIRSKDPSDWRILLVDTGELTMTGGRLKRVKEYIDGDIFMMTYGDGIANIDLKKLMEFHKNHGKKATVTAVKPPPRFGTLNIAPDGRVEGFQEKKHHPWINGGFFVLSKSVLDYIDDDSTPFEGKPIWRLIEEGELFSYLHEGFWRCMDTLSDKHALEEIWVKDAPWKIWKD